MILESIKNLKKYEGLHPNFKKVFEFLENSDLESLAEGKQDLIKDQVFLIVEKKQGIGRNQARLECHQKYIDIQICLTGIDEIGWSPLENCQNPSGPYDPQKDIQFFDDRPLAWCAIAPGTAAIFFPEDGHAPLVSATVLHKVIVKIKI